MLSSEGGGIVKILIANGGFYPAKNYGGPVVSIDNLCSLINDVADCFVICTDHELKQKERLPGIDEGWNERENCRVQYFPDEKVNYRTLSILVNEIKPDVIYINSLFDAMWALPLLRIAKRKSIRVLLAPRGQLCKNVFKGKYKKLPYIWYLKLFGLIDDVQFQSTSEEETETIKRYLGAKDEQIHFLTNLPSLPQKKLTYNEKKTGCGKFVFYSRIVPKKNLISAIKYFNGIEGKIEFDIYGPIEDKGYWGECQKEISNLPENVSVTYKGVIDHDRVFDVLSGYDAFVFPTWSENFGHVISEALFSGCPAIISDQTPWLGLEQAGAGWDIPLNDSIKYRKAIQKIVDFSSFEEAKMRGSAKTFAYNQFNLDKMKEEYISAFSRVL